MCVTTIKSKSDESFYINAFINKKGKKYFKNLQEAR